MANRPGCACDDLPMVAYGRTVVCMWLYSLASKQLRMETEQLGRGDRSTQRQLHDLGQRQSAMHRHPKITVKQYVLASSRHIFDGNRCPSK